MNNTIHAPSIRYSGESGTLNTLDLGVSVIEEIGYTKDLSQALVMIANSRFSLEEGDPSKFHWTYKELDNLNIKKEDLYPMHHDINNKDSDLSRLIKCHGKQRWQLAKDIRYAIHGGGYYDINEGPL